MNTNSLIVSQNNEESNDNKNLATLLTYFVTDSDTMSKLAKMLDYKIIDSLLNEISEKFEKLMPCIDKETKSNLKENLRPYERFLCDKKSSKEF